MNGRSATLDDETLGIAGRTHVTRLGDAQIVAQRPGSWQPESGQPGSVVNHPKSQPGHTTTSSLAGIVPVNAGPASPAKTTTRVRAGEQDTARELTDQYVRAIYTRPDGVIRVARSRHATSTGQEEHHVAASLFAHARLCARGRV